MISGIFHTAWRSLSLCPVVAQASLKEKLGPSVQLEISWSGFASVWIHSHQLTDTLSIDFSTSLFFFLTQSKYCIAFSTFWFVLQYCHEWKVYVGCHLYCKCVKSGETVVCHTCRLHGPLLSMQLMGINRVDHFCQVCSKHKAFLPEVSVWSQAGAEMAN